MRKDRENGNEKKTYLAVLLTAGMVAALTGCGDTSESSSSQTAADTSISSEAETSNGSGADGEAQAEPAAGTVYNAGKFSVEVPDGWVVQTTDDEDMINLIKGGDADDESARMTCPYICITAYDAGTDMWEDYAISWYDEGYDEIEFSTGDYSWHGVEGTISGLPAAAVFCSPDSGLQYSVSVTYRAYEGENGEISIYDGEVQSILGSLAEN